MAIGLVISSLVASCSMLRNPPRTGNLPARVAPVPEATSPDVAQALLEAHNAERARRHLEPLTLNAALTEAAAGHATWIATRGKMSHRGAGGSSPFERIKAAGYSFRAAGENVAYGFDSVAEVMVGWMRSPGHRRNILGDYTQVGVGRAFAPGGASYWCVTFGTPSGQNFP